MNTSTATHRAHVGVALLLAAAVSCGQAAAQEARPDALQIITRDKAYVLGVPVSRLVMFVPRGKLIQVRNPAGGAASSPRYFYFVDRGFDVSGWFEPAQSFPGMRKFWENETRAWSRRGLPAPKDVTFKKVGGWNAIIYDIPSQLGNNSHIRAEWVQDGTWIDIHLSLTSSRPNSGIRSALETFLGAVLVKERQR